MKSDVCLMGTMTLAFLPQAALSAEVTPAPVTGAAPAVPGLGIANLEAVIVNCNAYKAAQTQRTATYKPQLEQAEARRQQIIAQLQPLIDKLNKDRATPKPDQASIDRQVTEIKSIEEAGRQELQAILKPVALSDAYVLEQINDKVPVAAQTAMTKQKISVLFGPQNVLFAGQANNLNPAILSELNVILPSVSLTPPSDWAPKSLREGAGKLAGQ